MSKKEDSKNRYWNAILYPESMIENWEEEIGEILQLPYAYCIHDKDTDKNGEIRKIHVHLIIVFSNTTTYSHAKKIIERLGVVNKIEPVINIRWSYDYLIHASEDSKKKKKYQYDPNERITGNNFDIGAYEQLTKEDKKNIKQEISQAIRKHGFFNFADLDDYVMEHMDMVHYEVFVENQSYFNNVLRGYYLKLTTIENGQYKRLKQVLSEITKK